FSSSPFVFNYDVISVYGHDDEGLEKGVNKLIEICRKTSLRKPLSPRLNFDPEGPIVGGRLIEQRVKPAEAAPVVGEQNQSRESKSPIAHRFGIPLRGAAISPNGKYIAVGTDGYGENLFVYNNKGKLLWQKKVGVLNVQFLKFSKNSRKLQCSSNVFGREKPVEGQVGPIEFKVENTSVFDTRTGKRLEFLFGKKDPLGVVKKSEKVDPAALPPGFAKEAGKLTKTVGGKPAWTYTASGGQAIQKVAVSPNGKWVGLSAWSGNQAWLGGKPILALLDAKTGEKVWEKATDGIQPGHNKVGLLDSGVMLLIDGDAQGRPMFNLLDRRSGKTVYSFTGMPGAAGAGLPFKIGPEGEWIMVQAGGTDPQIRIIYLTGKSKDKIIRFDDEVNQQQFTPDNSKLLAGVWEDQVVMIDMATGKRL
ncbi:MAG: hypothetical protein QF662_08530, partial [Phycisphaerae bacterium]|nr:hypothetical protein [Phycisphaerae bacterium]